MGERFAYLDIDHDINERRRLFAENGTDEAIRLENPRPITCRHNNDYTDILNRSTLPTKNYKLAANGQLPVKIDNCWCYGLGGRTPCSQCSQISGSGRQSLSSVSCAVKMGTFVQSLGDVKSGTKLVAERCEANAAAKSTFSSRGGLAELKFNHVEEKFPASLVRIMPSSSIPAAVGDAYSQSSIMCPQCGKCRCADCARPRNLPSTYLCGRSCLCSSDTVVDCLSCACCLKGCLYHAGLDEDGFTATSATCHPSTKASLRCQKRNACASTATAFANSSKRSLLNRGNFWKILCTLGACLFLPCLWCYLPLMGCAKLCSFCYARYHNNGCRCAHRPDNATSVHRRLLATAADNASNMTVCTNVKRSKSDEMGIGLKMERIKPASGNKYVHLERRLLTKSFSTGCDNAHQIDTSRSKFKWQGQISRQYNSQITKDRTKVSCSSDSLLNKVITEPP